MKAFGVNQFYQSLPALGIRGQRSTDYRLQAYRLQDFLRPRDRVLDIGCNTGFLSVSVADRVRAVEGIDPDENLVSVANEVARYLGCTNCTFTTKMFQDLTFEPVYEFIFSFAVHRWIGLPLEEYGRKLRQLLKEGGKLIIESQQTDAGMDVAWDDNLAEIKKAGFASVFEGFVAEATDYPRKFAILKKASGRKSAPLIDHYYYRIEGHFNFEDIYEDMVVQYADGAKFVEVGAYLGQSAVFMAVEIANSGKNIEFTAYDLWQGNENVKLEPKVGNSTQRATLDVFRKNIEPVKSLIRYRRLDSVSASREHGDMSLDFVFIDADHQYASMRADILAWLPKVRIGGHIGGHDYTNADGVKRAVDEIFAGEQLRFSKNSWLFQKRSA